MPQMADNRPKKHPFSSNPVAPGESVKNPSKHLQASTRLSVFDDSQVPFLVAGSQHVVSGQVEDLGQCLEVKHIPDLLDRAGETDTKGQLRQAKLNERNTNEAQAVTCFMLRRTSPT